ncbi:fibrobacter succinogenes major paralogous domain-containing protein [Chlorobium sp. N1]|uniref:fibrobacter succinogenes major paralogous domain-containing protein n=1 Tax=Chlorobium sp. N1 TaxID=2491138 RepID=UPI00103879A6|nr:fibrobacter succinogenes major paralogous domain-containing protein [Chlorobium sp. N1]TCD48306.1 hypothetical protein E0L29_04485 [Chlorobium sp. N1]
MHTKPASILLLLLFAVTAACSRPSPTAVDVDGNSYRTARAGSMVWTAENLSVSRFRNGDPIPEVRDPAEWASLTTPAWCWNSNSPENGRKYGRLYNWYAVSDPRGLAPEGWHVATDEEWSRLTETLGGEQVAGGKLKAKEGWQEPNEGGLDTIGFRLLPAGARRDTDGHFMEPGGYNRLWTSTEISDKAAWGRSIGYFDSAIRRGKASKKTGFSVRCVRN